MDEPEDPIGGLPDIVRNADRPIIIYQGGPPNQLDQAASNSLGLLSWLALLSLCLFIIGFCFWSVWNPAHDPKQASLVYAEGRPLGLARQVEERRQINKTADGVVSYLDRLRADNFDRRRTRASHALFSGPGGIDELRREWDAKCQSVRESIYDRRIGRLDAQIAELQRQRARQSDAVQAARLDEDLQTLVRQRTLETANRRADSDPALRCTPSALAPLCAAESADPWCRPERGAPREFTGKAVR